MNYKQRIPQQQDIIWLDFMPSTGNEITGRHPAVVISISGYTELTGLVAVSPITQARNNRLTDFFIPIKTRSIEGYINPLQFFTYSVYQRRLQFTGEKLGDLAFAQIMETHRQLLDL